MAAVESDRTGDGALPPADGSRGTRLLGLFTTALLIVVAAVWMVAAIGGWWVLAIAFTVHLVVTAFVLTAIFAVLRERGNSSDALRAR